MTGSVGLLGEEKPVLISPDGKLTYLPLPDDREWAYGSSRGISPDGKMVCGHLSAAGVKVWNNVTGTMPVVWDIDGDNITCTMLPYPEKDFTGRAPQGHHPLFVSESKNRIIGREIDYSGSGFIEVWDRTAPGEPWTYNVLGEDVIYKDGPDFPEYPAEPTQPDYKEYMTEDETAAYEAAYQAWIDNGYSGDMPQYENFINDEARKSQYLKALDEYNQALTAYNEKVNEFFDVYAQRLTNRSLDGYSITASFNGRYVGTSLSVTDMSSDDWKTAKTVYPCYYDIDDNYKYMPLENNDFAGAGPVSITGNGDISVTIPASASAYETRNSYVIPAGGDNLINVYDYLGSTNNGKVNRRTFVDAGMEFSYTGYDPETYEEVDIKDSVIVGYMQLSADGKNAAGFYAVNYGISGWAINDHSTSGISQTKLNATEAVLRSNVIENGRIEFVADVESATLFDLGGAVLFRGRPQGDGMKAPSKEGLYILQSKLKNGALRTDKIVVRQ